MSVEFPGGLREMPQERELGAKEKRNLKSQRELIKNLLENKQECLDGIKLTVRQMNELRRIDPYSEESCGYLARELGLGEDVVGALKVYSEMKDRNPGETLH